MNESSKYIELIQSYVDGLISGEEFQQRYFRVMQDDPTRFEGDTWRIIATMFSDLDSYCGDPELANYDLTDPYFGDIDDTELRKRALVALEGLKRECRADSPNVMPEGE